MVDQQYDLVVYGATGFTGRLICAYLHQQRVAGRKFRWAMAGRALEKLEALRVAISGTDVGLICADASDPASLSRLVSSTRLVISTVGPYQLYGSGLVATCAQSGTDYIDICGEPLWMRDMIDAYEDTARASGARILFSCGFDSIPAELGVYLCQQEAVRLQGKPMSRVRGRMRKFVGGPSGGSVASGMAMMRLATEFPAKAALLADPFALTPGFHGPEHGSYQVIEDEPDVGRVGPFTLGPTDMKNVHRSNLLMGHPYGIDFVYDEKLVDPPPLPALPPSPDNLPKPGDGPADDVMANGCFDLLVIGEEAGRTVSLAISGADDPGYRTTAKFVGETALALLSAGPLPGGIWTPIAALRDALANKLFEHAGIDLDIHPVRT